MNVLAYLIPISLILGGAGLAFFVFTLRANQYDDPEGNSQRILSGEYDDHPKPD
ncbi:MAG: cbb3-type cytochrome oxidase assembly protein CcoS [Pelagimonas sp.]|jgi:cbb3-type cytochrome oxidase maturation protein